MKLAVLAGIALLVPALLAAGIRERLREPERSVCVVFRNCEEMVEGLLRQVRWWASLRGRSVRLVVAAGGSADGTPALLRQLALRERWIEFTEEGLRALEELPTVVLRGGERPAQALRILTERLE